MNVLLIINQEGKKYRNFLLPSHLLDGFDIDDLNDYYVKWPQELDYTAQKSIEHPENEKEFEAKKKELRLSRCYRKRERFGRTEEVVFDTERDALVADIYDRLDSWKEYEDPPMPCTFDKLFLIGV